MKWEKLKELIIEEVSAHPKAEACVEIKKAANERLMTVGRYLDTYDVRAVSALRSRFPHLFPKYLRTCTLYLNKDRQGNWTIDAKAK